MNILRFSKYMIVLITLFVLVTACSTNALDTLEKPIHSKIDKETILFRITWKSYSGRGEAIQTIVDSFNEKNEINYEIIIVDGDEEEDSIGPLLDSKEQVDILVLPYRLIKYYGEQDKLINLTPDMENEKNLFFQELWELGVVNGQVFGIPWLGHSMGLIYNKDLLDQSGTDPKQIKSLDSFVAALENVEKNTNAQGIGLVGADHHDISWMVNQFIYGFGSSLVNAEGTKVTINNEASRKAIDFYKNVLGEQAQDNWLNDTGVEVMKHFRESKVAFEIQSIWGVTDIDKNGNPFEVGVIPLKDISLKAEVGPMMVALSSKIEMKKKEAALQFIRYLISKEGQEKILDGEYSIEHDANYPFRIPVRKDLSESRFFELNPEYINFLEGFHYPSIDVPIPKWEIIKQEYYEIGLHQVMTGETTIDDFLQLVEAKGNDILAEE